MRSIITGTRMRMPLRRGSRWWRRGRGCCGARRREGDGADRCCRSCVGSGMRKILSLAIVTLFSSVALAGGHGNDQPRRDPQPPIQQATHGAKKVDLVIALDTSSSMDGLIDSARAKLWDVVNLLAHAKPQPLLR